MSISPVLTFKAGKCEVDASAKPYKIHPLETPGYIYLYKGEDDGFTHFCWRPRNKPLDDEDNLDLFIVPGDAIFVPLEHKTGDPSSARTDGRIFVFKFTSSADRHIFWLQSKSQSPEGDNAWFSPRDLKLGDIVNRLLQGEDNININAELIAARNSTQRRDDDDDEPMEDVEGHGDRNEHHQGGTGGAGPDATGGDVREEGESSREGGADGARAAAAGNLDATASEAVRNLLASLGGGGAAGAGAGSGDKLYPALNDLLTPSETIPMIQDASEEDMNKLLDFLPPTTIVLAQAGGADVPQEPTPDVVEAAKLSMSLGEKKDLVSRVLRSPQFTQSLASLTVALRDGGLPTLADALRIKVDNGGYIRRGGMPLGGGPAVEAFVQGVRNTVKDN